MPCTGSYPVSASASAVSTTVIISASATKFPFLVDLVHRHLHKRIKLQLSKLCESGSHERPCLANCTSTASKNSSILPKVLSSVGEPRLRRRSQPVRAHWTTCKWRPPRDQARRSAAWLHSRIRTPSGLSDHLLNGLVCAFHVWFRLIRTRTPSDLLVYSLNNFVDFGSAVCLQLPGVTFLRSSASFRRYVCGLPLVSLVTSMAHMNRYPLSFTVRSQNSSSSLASPPLRPPVGSEVEAKIQHASSIVLLHSVHEPFASA